MLMLKKGRQEAKREKDLFILEAPVFFVLIYLVYLQLCHRPQVTLSTGQISPLTCQKLLKKTFIVKLGN